MLFFIKFMASSQLVCIWSTMGYKVSDHHVLWGEQFLPELRLCWHTCRKHENSRGQVFVDVVLGEASPLINLLHKGWWCFSICHSVSPQLTFCPLHLCWFDEGPVGITTCFKNFLFSGVAGSWLLQTCVPRDVWSQRVGLCVWASVLRFPSSSLHTAQSRNGKLLFFYFLGFDFDPDVIHICAGL